jgi:hypothetical protein
MCSSKRFWWPHGTNTFAKHDRFTRADRDVEAQMLAHVEEEPVVKHLIQAELDA